jgi:hypothetical protein
MDVRPRFRAAPAADTASVSFKTRRADRDSIVETD